MSDHSQTNLRIGSSEIAGADSRRFVRSDLGGHLPDWLSARLLGEDEHITWVVGPRFNPSWEYHITHPGLFVVALALGATCLGVGRLWAGSWANFPIFPALGAGAVVIGSIYVLALSNSYFTRLVVTTGRILILQGHEVCRTWSIRNLPPSLIHYGMWQDGERSPTVDLDTLKTMLGSSSEKFAESKTILALGKQIDQITSHKKAQS
jgi:hypothetical protein